MCRNIKTLYHLEPPATEEEVRAAATQYVRKVSGFRKSSSANQRAFDQAVTDVVAATATLLGVLVTAAPPRTRKKGAS